MEKIIDTEAYLFYFRFVNLNEDVCTPELFRLYRGDI